jgi:putative heme iron utilization protein
MAEALTKDAIANICNEMNEDHADALLRVAHDAGARDATSAQIADLDKSGINLILRTPAGEQTLYVAFDHMLRDANDARQTLTAMTSQP